jgi:RIO kinase 1
MTAEASRPAMPADAPLAGDPGRAETREPELEDATEYAEGQLLGRRDHRAWNMSRRARRSRRASRATRPQVPDDESELGFQPSHARSDNERALLNQALGVFYHDDVITDVLARVKGGKDANVYCCSAHPSTQLALIAAKIYRPRAHRTMRNDAIYREGRLALDREGKTVARDARLARAMANKTAFGVRLLTYGWVQNEHEVLRALYAAGASVPRPVGHVGRAILMEYFGDADHPAPTMDGVRFSSRREAGAVLERLLWHVELMLRHGWVHGDLSPFNVLVWDGRAVVIDFPQAVTARTNGNAEWLLRRDIDRLAGYFSRYGIAIDPGPMAESLWARYAAGRL